jgi:hypothetical protein
VLCLTLVFADLQCLNVAFDDSVIVLSLVTDIVAY